MAKFEDHIKQAKRNLYLLHHTNQSLNDAWDWQVTMSFYTAVHLVNAHIAAKENAHYRSHKQVKHALNPTKSTYGGSELSEDIYLSYVKLQNLSRRSRYLCLDSDSPDEDEKTYLTYDKHLSKAIYHLDKLLSFIKSEYGEKFPVTPIDCPELEGKTFAHFKYHKYTPASVSPTA